MKHDLYGHSLYIFFLNLQPSPKKLNEGQTNTKNKSLRNYHSKTSNQQAKQVQTAQIPKIQATLAPKENKTLLRVYEACSFPSYIQIRNFHANFCSLQVN